MFVCEREREGGPSYEEAIDLSAQQKLLFFDNRITRSSQRERDFFAG